MIIDIIVILLVAFSVYRGYKKGLVGILVGLVSLLLAIILGFIFQIPISNYLYENTNVGKSIEENIVKVINDNINNEQTDKTGKENNIMDVFNKLENNAKKQEKNTVEQTSKMITMFILKGISFITILIVVYIICFVLQLVLNVVFDLPLLNVVNKFGGIGANLIQVVLKIWIFLGIVYFISSISSVTVISDAIQKTTLTKALYENNVLVKIIESNLKI